MSAYKSVVAVFLLIKYMMVIGDTVPGELSKEKCKKYAELVPKSYQCPFSYSNLTLGNSFATEGEFPHTVILGFKGKFDNEVQWRCSATLISEDFILAAAHCLATSSGEIPIVAKIGVIDVNSTENGQEIKVKRIIVHPDYHRPQVYNDIGLIQLEKKVDINTNARPACLFTEKEINVDKLVNSGWGHTEFMREFNNKLQKVVLEIFDEQQCNQTYNKKSNRIQKGITYDTMLCAGTKSIPTTQLQTGGPLTIPHVNGEGFNCIQDIIGVASFGKLGGVINIPDVYTRVSAFVPWIEQNVWN